VTCCPANKQLEAIVNSSPAPATGPFGSGDMADVVAVVGEALVDFVPAGRAALFEAAPGGSPANVAVGLARLGVPVRLLARIADDFLGRRIRAHLSGNGVDLSHTVRAQEPTSLAIVALGEGGVPEYDFRMQGTADWQWRDAELVGVVDGRLVALHAGSLALTMPPGAEVLARLVGHARQHVTVSYDPNCRPQLMGAPDTLRPQVEALVEAADVVKVSAEDLAWLLPGQPPVQVARAWRTRGPALVVVTLGPGGSWRPRRAGWSTALDGLLPLWTRSAPAMPSPAVSSPGCIVVSCLAPTGVPILPRWTAAHWRKCSTRRSSWRR
jgi:fructokinase